MHEGRGSGRTDRIGLPEGERLTRETKNVQTQIDSTPRARGDSSLQTQCSSPRTQGAARGRLCGLPPSPGLGGGGRGGRCRPRPRRNGQPSCAAGRTFSGRKDENRQGPHPPSAAIAGGAQGPPAAAQAAEDAARWPRAGRACRLSHAGAQSARRPHPGSRPAFRQSRSAAASLPPSDRSRRGRTDGSGSGACASRALLT